MNKVSIKMPGYDRFAIKYLRRRDVDILNINYSKDGNIYTIFEHDLEKLDENSYEIVIFGGIKKWARVLYRNRHFLLASIQVIMIMLFLSNVIVSVEIIHSNKDVRMLIEDELYDHGVKPFIMKKSFKELQKIKETIKNEHPSDIEWLEIVDEGMRYTVRVEERIITDEKSEPEYCNVISTKDAVVLSSVPKKGQEVVVPNDFVKKDSVLISGKVTFNEETKSYVCASGVVYGNTWYRVAIAMPYGHVEKNYTKKRKNNIAFEWGSVYNRIFKIHFDEYDVTKKKMFSLGKFALYKEVVEEYVSEEKTYSEEEALNEAMKEAREKLLVKLDSESEILNEKVLQSSSYDSIMNVEMFYSVKEIISTQVEGVIEEQVPKEETE